MNAQSATAKKIIRDDAPEITSIERNPFAVIDATTRDDRKRIVEMAEEKSFTGDHELCNKARADLTNPRNRLSAEISWLPGVSPKRGKELLAMLKDNPQALRERKDNISPIALANLLSAALELIHDELDTDEWTAWILDLATAAEGIKPEELLRDINEDRTISNFPEIKGTDIIQSELNERQRAYKDAVKNALDRMPPLKLLDVVTSCVVEATNNGRKHAPPLIDDMVDTYALHLQSFLKSEADKITNAVDTAALALGKGKGVVKAHIKKIDKIVRHWDKFAQPIQLSMKSRGLPHEMSKDVAIKVRSLAITLANEHNMFDLATEITDILQEAFAELPELLELAEGDAKQLEDLSKQAAAQSYQTEIGTIFKTKLAISPEEIVWGSYRFATDSIKSVSWGGTRINGSINYKISLGTDNGGTTIELRRQDAYTAFIERLWKTVCVRLMIEFLKDLQDGKKVRFGSVVVDDNGIEMIRHRTFKTEQIYMKWSEVSHYSSDGNFVIQSQKDKNIYVRLSYQDTSNTHILEHCIDTAFKNWKGRLSGILS